MADQPRPTVAFLFTDIEGSTRLWQEHPAAMGVALARHDALLRAEVVRHGGRVFKTVGDAVCAAFPTASAALAAAIAGQRALAAETWGETGPLRVRMAVHVGPVEERDDDFFGPTLNRVARLLAIGHGGQTLLSLAAAEIVQDLLPTETQLHDLGRHRLKDLSRPEHVFQATVSGLPTEFPALRSLDARPNNLPTPPTPVVGREEEAAAAHTLLTQSDVRLLTLTGPGGVGKTRLSLHVAAELLEAFPDGVWFVPLAAITEPELVVSAIAQALGVRETGGLSLLASVHDALRDQSTLLVLDNFEQVVAAAPIVAELLAACPGLKALVSSRTRLHLRGERELIVPPLAVPAFDQAPAVNVLTEYPAVRLFVARAQDAKPAFDVTESNAAAVAAICRRLDGLPLALELAAARAKMLAPAALLARLVTATAGGDTRSSALPLLTTGPRDLPERHQALRATIAWSYDLLTPDEQAVFRRLSVFVDGCTLDAVERVMGDGSWVMGDEAENPYPLSPITHHPSPDVLDAVTSLLDQSLLRQIEPLDDDGASEPRLTMLETIREYGLEQLATNGEVEAMRARHADYFLALAEEAEPFLDGAEQTDWLRRLEAEHGNLRAALAWLRERGEGNAALRLAGALWQFWWLRGDFTEGRTQLESLLGSGADGLAPQTRAKALNGAGMLAESQSDYATAEAFHEEALAITRRLDDRAALAWSLNNLGVIAHDRGDLTRASALLEESAEIARAVGDKKALASALNDLGQVACANGEYERADALFTESLKLDREIGNTSHVARRLNNLGVVALERRDYARAASLFFESLPLQRQVGDKQSMAYTLNNLAEIAVAEGDDERARDLYEESLVLARETGGKLNTANVLCSLAGLARRRGDLADARAFDLEAVSLYRSVDDLPGVAACLGGLAEVVAADGDFESAARVFGAAAAVDATAFAPDLGFGPDNPALASISAALGDEAFAAAWRAGQELTVEQAIAEATTGARRLAPLSTA